MARVTIEDCLSKIGNHFDLVLVASHRARQILAGAELTIDAQKHKASILALREIAEGTIDKSVLDAPLEENREEAEKELAALLAETDLAEETGISNRELEDDEDDEDDFDEDLDILDELELRENEEAIEASGQIPFALSDTQEIISLEGLQAEEDIAEADNETIDDTQTEIQELTAEDMADMSSLNLDAIADTEIPDLPEGLPKGLNLTSDTELTDESKDDELADLDADLIQSLDLENLGSEADTEQEQSDEDKQP